MRAVWRINPRTRRFLVTVLVVLALAVAGALVHPRYVVNRAGPAVDTLGDLGQTPIIEVSGATTYPTSGSLAFTTVAQYGGPGYELNVWSFLAALVDPEAEVLPYDAVFPPEATREQVQDATSAAMAGSQNSAEAVAFQRLGFAEQAVVGAVMPDGPAANTLRVGDRILAVDGTTITRTAQVSTLIQASKAATVQLKIERAGATTSVEVAPTTIQGRRVVGVGLQAKFPAAPKVTINAGDVGGPSAGLMFSLGVYDKLTPGELTGGNMIAGTGTISLDGSVGAIGGITHKMVGAVSDGANWFLAPAGNCEQVVGKVPTGLAVVRVASFTEAVNAVEQIAAGAGDRLPTCR